MKIEAAIFDVDHTIIRKSSGRCFIMAGFKAGMFTFTDILKIPYYYRIYRRGEMNIESLGTEIPAVIGRSRQFLEKLSRETFDRYLRKEIHDHIAERIARFHAESIPVILASSSFRILLQPLADYLGIDHIIATELEFENDIASGRISGKPCFGEQKLKKTGEWLIAHGINPLHCAFYTDSVHDLPLLEAVGSCTGVNPDKKLLKICLERKWEVLRL